jgi:hypothetical protein
VQFSLQLDSMALRHGATLNQFAAIVAKSRNQFYFSQRLLQLVSQHFFQIAP